MATMHPSNPDEINFAAESERVVYDALLAQLPDRVHVYYSVKWQEAESNESHSGEGDFIVAHPDFGILILEVKGGHHIEYTHGVWTLWDNPASPRQLKKSPYEQAETTRYSVVKKYTERYYSQMFCTHGHAVVFPYYTIPRDMCCETTTYNTIDKSNMSQLRVKITQIFKSYANGHTTGVSQETFSRIRELFDGDSSSKASALTLCESSKKGLASIAAQQDATLSLLYHYPQALVVGSAGTGKTYMAVMKVKEFCNQYPNVLYVCFNRLNAQKVAADLYASGFHAVSTTFHQLMLNIIGQQRFQSLIDESSELEGVLDIVTAESTQHFDAIVVDEAQDFSVEWAFVLRHLLKDENNSPLYVFYDEDQNIFQRNFGEAFLIPYPPFVLRRVLRNTNSIWNWTVQQTQLGIHSLANHITGLVPKVHHATNGVKAVMHLEKQIRALLRDGILPSQITILSDRKKENSPLAGIEEICSTPIVQIDTENISPESIGFCTIQAYKGLESDVVICLENKETHNQRLMYVAYTRARCLLHVITY